MNLSSYIGGLSLVVAFGFWNLCPVLAQQAADPHATEEDEHAHAEVGPHGGDLIELGEEEYHAEIIHDEKTGTITVHLLDGEAKKLVAIPAADIKINLKHGEKAEQFKLAASPIATDPKGTTSRFVSTDTELAEELDIEGCEAKLVVVIAGKQYRGDIAHHHDEEHDVEHEAGHVKPR